MQEICTKVISKTGAKRERGDVVLMSLTFNVIKTVAAAVKKEETENRIIEDKYWILYLGYLSPAICAS